MVMLLHLDCIQRNEWSLRTFRGLIFYIMYPFVRHYKDIFGIHVSTQTVVAFWMLVRVRRVHVCVYLLRTRHLHTLRRYNDSGSMILVHIIVVLQIGATSYCCLLP